MTTSPQPTPEAIEAVTRALVPGFGYMDAIEQRVHLGVARDILTAAVIPAIRAEVLAEVGDLQVTIARVEALASSYENDRHGMQMWVDAARGIRRALANPTPTAKEADHG